jgi:GTP-binding protein
VILAANKVDEPGLPAEMGELNSLGFGEPVPVSAQNGLGMELLAEAIARALGELPASPPEAALMKLAIVGKRNAGKSTFINALAGQERVIVSETPGTTRDSVDVTVEIGGRKFMLIDTAGIRKRRRIVQHDIEFYSYHRALRSIRRADVVALMIDASVPVSKVDKDLSRDIIDQFKPVVLVVNKWDLARGQAAGEDYEAYFDKVFPELTYAPICLTSATTGMNIHQTIRMAEQLFDQAQVRVPTAQLNAVVRQITTQRGPSHKAGTKPPKILYVSQITTCPPTIVFFVNDVRSFDRSYQRYIVNQLRRHLPYAEVPIRVLFRSRREHEGAGQGAHRVKPGQDTQVAEGAEMGEPIDSIEAIEAFEADATDLLRQDEQAGRQIPPDESPMLHDDGPTHAGGARKRRAHGQAPRGAKSGKAPRYAKSGKTHGGPAKPGAGKFKARGGKPRTPGARPKGKGGSPKPAGPAGPRTSGGPKAQGPKGRGPKGGGPKGPRGPRKRRP